VTTASAITPTTTPASTTTTSTSTSDFTSSNGLPVSPAEAEAVLLTYFLSAGAREYAEAWSVLSIDYQQQYESFAHFEDFWAGVASVGPADPDVVPVDSGPGYLVFSTEVFFALTNGERSDETITVTVRRQESGTILIDDYQARRQ